jgi:large subunit ribosomal protein L29
MKMKTVRELEAKDLEERIQEMRSELLRMRTNAASGTLRKDSGKIMPMRRDIARMKTRQNEMKKK